MRQLLRWLLTAGAVVYVLVALAVSFLDQFQPARRLSEASGLLFVGLLPLALVVLLIAGDRWYTIRWRALWLPLIVLAGAAGLFPTADLGRQVHESTFLAHRDEYRAAALAALPFDSLPWKLRSCCLSASTWNGANGDTVTIFMVSNVEGFAFSGTQAGAPLFDTAAWWRVDSLAPHWNRVSRGRPSPAA